METVSENLPFTIKNISTALEDVNGSSPRGVQLRVEELKTMGAGMRGEGPACYRTEMQSHWLANGQDHSWHEEVEQVWRRLEEAHSGREAKGMEEKGQEALDLEASLQELVTSERNVALVQRKLEELRGRNESFRRKQGEWRREADQWKQQSETRGEILATTGLGELLRGKGLPEKSNLTDECYLCKKLIDEQVKQSKQLISYHQQIKQHQRYLEQKLEEVRKLEVVEECMHERTAELLQNLEKVDTKQAEKQTELQEQLENLLEKMQQTLRSLESTLRDNDRALQDSEDYLRECRCDISEMVESLKLALQVMKTSLSTVKQCKMQVEEEINEKLEILRSTLIGGVGVAAGGAALGQILGPVGALVGAGIGALVGGIAGLASGTSEHKKKGRESDKNLATLEQERSAYEKVLRDCQHSAKCAMVLLEASTDQDLSLCSSSP